MTTISSIDGIDGMNDRQFAFWNDYARQCADLLGLKDVHVQVMREPPDDDDAHALVWTHSFINRAAIYLSPEFLGLTGNDPVQQRQVMAHELIHIHLTGIMDRVQTATEFLPESDLVAALGSFVHQDIERATDCLSYVVAALLPLPELITGRNDGF